MASDKRFLCKTASNINFLAWIKPERSLGMVQMMNVYWQLNGGEPAQI